MALPVTVTAKIILRNLPYDINTLSITNVLDTVYNQLTQTLPNFSTTPITLSTSSSITINNSNNPTTNNASSVSAPPTTYTPTLRRPRIVYLENGKQK